MRCDVLVIGAGPGGCAAALHLRRAGWRVLLVERRRAARDKLCGEFMSAEGVASLRLLGLEARLGACPQVGRVLVGSAAGTCWEAPLPRAGMGCSRRRLHRLLLERCVEGGVEVVQGVKVGKVEGDLAAGFRVEGRGREGVRCFSARLVVGAWGARGGMGFCRQRGRARVGDPLMALKVHAGGELPGRVELHGFAGGYAGLCPVEGGRVNLCLLARVSAFRAAGGEGGRFSARVMGRNPLLAARLERLEPRWEEALAAANLRFGAFECAAGDVVVVGDGAGAINPLCGDGMAMAMRAAEVLCPLADEFLAGSRRAPALLEEYERQWQREFGLRLKLGKVLHSLLLAPRWSRMSVALLRRWSALGQGALRWTRGGAPVG